MLSLHTNAAALSTQGSLGSTQKALSTSMTRLGTGLRINSAMDDAAGLQIATRLNAQTRGMAVAQRNTQNGISMMQTAEGALNEVSNILLRMKDLATEAFSASSTATDKTAMQGEYDALGTELTNIVKNTSFGGTQLFSNGTTVDGTLGKLSAAMNFQIGASAGESMAVNVSTQLTGLTTALGNVSTQYAAAPAAGTELSAATNTMLTTLGGAIDKVGELRASLGAASNRLDHVYNNLQNMSTNTSAAKGRIMDVDYATETSNMTTKQMLMQASSAMLKQSNGMSGMVMSLLQ
ncbi:flagellin N-terminal helical domain-containing protein [Paucibacter sp. XJ19-41]|uniref:flagellin N-terminal helical domain-containing protein n=1 Tax=Paucibacter sp. XJ19-41 TaxID=2927824 RepID=UPI00234B6D41|nr:flagellin [Paucibacter sp. XJ19-41]MDC6169506.1 flagellin [Paucibacter sp. XJ19-41]